MPPPRAAQTVGVLTVDDHRGFREAAADIIAATPGFESVGEAASGEEALEAVAQLRPAVVILDVRMPGMGGIEVARRISSDHPDTVILLVSSDDLDDAPSATRTSGARAFMRKENFRPMALRSLWETHGR